MATNVTKNKKPRNRKNKIELVFNPDKRREFLGGFRKRKLERKKKAQEQLALELKAERKRLKQEARESYNKLVVSHRNIPELEHLFVEEYEEDDVTVKITELSTSEMAKQNNWIGENKPQYDVEEESDEENTENCEEAEPVLGMELKPKPQKNVKQKVEKVEFNSERDLKRTLKKQATKKVQQSRAFQLKNKLERQKNKKKSLRQKKERFKTRKQMNKIRGGKTPID